LAVVVIAMTSGLHAQPNYDESKVPKYTLPDPLVASDGTSVTDVESWEDRRREILELFEQHVYGRSPAPHKDVVCEVTSVSKNTLARVGAVRKQVTVYFSGDRDGPKMDILIYLPLRAERPVPTFLGLNFEGNHAIHNDPGITLSKSWMRDDGKGVVDHRATEESRGAQSGRWAVESIIKCGYALATIYYGDIDPDDYGDNFQDGVHPLFYKEGQTKPAADEWGAIGAWAWGLSQAMDYFETDDEIDHKHVAVMGHSRLGKTALWAGASDTRFALVISNNSGCGGAALSRRRFGETVKVINTNFKHWFCDNFSKYNDNEDALPVDQHMLISLIAPRPVYIASAQEDRWADSRGEFLSGFHADPVYRLLGTNGIGAEKMPELDKPVMNTIGYHIRTGGHDVTEFDWKCYMAFADKHFGFTNKQ